MLRLMLWLLLGVFVCHFATSTESEENNLSNIVLKDFIPIINAFRRRAEDYHRQIWAACPNDDPDKVDCDCASWKLPPYYIPEFIGDFLTGLSSGKDDTDDLSFLVYCQPEYCICQDGTMVTMNNTKFCEDEDLKDINPDYIAHRMSKWAEEITQCDFPEPEFIGK